MPGLGAEALAAAAAGLFGGGSAGAWLAARTKGKVDLEQVVQEAAGKLIDKLQARVDRLEARVGELEAERTLLKEAAHAANNRASSESARARLAEELRDQALRRAAAAEGVCRQLQQIADSLQRALVAAGVPIPAPAMRAGDFILLPASPAAQHPSA